MFFSDSDGFLTRNIVVDKPFCSSTASVSLSFLQKTLILNDLHYVFLFRRGQIAGKMDDETLRQLLTRFSERTRQTTTVKVGTFLCVF